MIGPFSSHYACLPCLCRAPCVQCPWMRFWSGVHWLVRRVKWGRGRFFILPGSSPWLNKGLYKTLSFTDVKLWCGESHGYPYHIHTYIHTSKLIFPTSYNLKKSDLKWRQLSKLKIYFWVGSYLKELNQIEFLYITPHSNQNLLLWSLIFNFLSWLHFWSDFCRVIARWKGLES